jgi:hypothetical protein
MRGGVVGALGAVNETPMRRAAITVPLDSTRLPPGPLSKEEGE